MWSRNALTERLNLKWPILQAPMGSITTPALAAAVSNAGGLGALGMWGFSPEDAERCIAGFRQQSGGGLNVNYPLWPEPKMIAEAIEAMRKHLQPHYDAQGLGPVPQPRASAGEVSSEHLAMLLRAKPQVVSFHFGLPPWKVTDAIKGAGIFMICSATTVAEARILEDRGVDAVIAQGTEAGGHRGTFAGVDMIQQAGLSAVREASDASTVVTDMITGRPARLFRNKLTDDLVASALEAVSFPAQMSLIAPLGAAGDRAVTAFFAGQSAALAKDGNAASLVVSLGQETTRRLRAFHD